MTSSSLKFVHLRVHSEYSVVDGLVRLKPLAEKLLQQQTPAVALTDHMNLFAAVKFYRTMRAKGIKPILGGEIQLVNELKPQAPSSLVLLCQNEQGYQHLIQLISKAYLQDKAQSIPLIEPAWLSQYHEGLIALSGGRLGNIGQAFLNEQPQLAEQYCRDWVALFGDRFYLEVSRTGQPDEEAYIQQVLQLAQTQQVPVVATNDVRFLEAEDFSAHEVRVCIHRGELLSDTRRKKDYTQQQYLRTPLEMQQLFADIPSALTNSVEIAKRCNVQLTLGKYFLPAFPIPKGMTEEQYFIQRSEEGLKQRLALLYDPEDAAYEQHCAPYHQRLKEELAVINKMGFSGYFLIVADFIQWSKENDIPVGPGRGSGAGSLVAYALGITGLDPLAYDLLFERFLNPERISMPDFDIDFCMDGRDRVIDYVASRYGRDSVSQIITFGTMAAKAAVRDVGRVLGNPYGFVDKIAKLIPFELGMTLDKALAQEDALQQRYQQEEEVREMIDMARAIEGITRNVGKHAGGVVIAPSAITDFTAVYREPGGHHILTQLDKDDDELIGLVKFDFLGLRTLTIIDWAIKAVNQRLLQKQQSPINIDLIPVDDAAVFTLMQSCQTTAVFQLESRGMKDLIKRLQPDCFEDIIALVALFRPGPLQSGMVDDFIDRKHGRAKVEYPHPDVEPILRPTYGVILYQEQVMQIAQVLAGYTLGGADLLRRAMGKKKPEEMAKQRQIFTDGAVKRGVESKTATYIFDLMEKFAGYGFNKSHSAAYALVAYQTAWLKTHYPAEFMAAVLSSDMDNTDKVVIFVEECAQMKLSLLSPDVNQSHYQFTVNDEGEILYGLGAIKGVGHAAIDSALIERQQHGSFKDLFEFCQRVDLKKMNRKVLEALIKSGAFDGFQQTRASLMASLEKALKMAEQKSRDHLSGQQDLFSLAAVGDDKIAYNQAADWTLSQRLQGEKESLGYYVSGHPLDVYRNECQHFISGTLANVTASYEQSVVVVGLIAAIRTMNTKRGNRMAFMTLEDGTAKIEVAVFSDVYQDKRPLLAKDEIVVVEGEVSVDDYTGGHRMSCRDVMTLPLARSLYGKCLLLSTHQRQDIQKVMAELATVLQEYPKGECPITVEYRTPQAKARLQLADQFSISPTDELLDKIKQDLAIEVAIEYE